MYCEIWESKIWGEKNRNKTTLNLTFCIRMHTLRSRCIILQNNHILLVRNDGSDFYCLPWWNIEQGESTEKALVREIQEELSITPLSPIFIGIQEFDHTNTQGITKKNIDFLYLVTKYTWNLQDADTSSHAFELLDIKWVSLQNTEQLNIKPIKLLDRIQKNIADASNMLDRRI